MQIQKSLRLTSLVLTLGIAGVIFSACQQYGGQANSVQSSPTNQGSTANQPGTTAVTIQNMTFSPKNLQVKVGQTVTWTNKDQYTHTVSSTDGSFDSGNLIAGGSYSFTFTKPGTFEYHCNIHTSMTAQVTVTQ